MTHTILHIDASARTQGSVTRTLSRAAVRQLDATRIIRRDLNAPLPQITETWVTANFTPAPDRSTDQTQVLTQSDALVEEIAQADTLVIGVPVYNFSVPASLKAWIDLVARAGLSFRYTPEGPQGLMQGKRAIIAIASGGVPIGSELDFASGYLRHVLGFIGITDVQIVTADHLNADGTVDLDAALTGTPDAVAA